MDEAFILENTIRYIKYLQERVEILEEQARKPVVLVKKSQLVVDDEESSSTEMQSAQSIEARVCDKHVLIRIKCEKRKGVLLKIIGEVEKLNLSIVNTTVVPYGSLSHYITITVEMDKEISVLEKAIRYMEYLQKRVKILEEQARKAEIVTKNSQVVVDDNESSSTELQQPPAIKARECGKNVLLRIRCEKRKGILVKIIDEVEKLNLGIVNTNVVSFGSLSLEVNITAEKEKEFSLTVNEIVQTVDDVLRSAA